MSTLITTHWNSEDRMLPGIDCIAYPNGSVTLLNMYSLYNPNNQQTSYYCRPLCDTTIESIEKYDATYWTRVDEWASLPYQGGKLYAGDGAMGNQGFIAHADANDQLVWGIFFENTNPIKSLEIKGTTLCAINEHTKLQIEINLECLTDIQMFAL
ncbi:MAG: hypothetical protein ACK5JF_02600 [Oscillospiraceae bacterium]